ncbi:lipase family protein [Amycolatopsis samaneae]|uniref:Lipase family protein n=1 Tax=Amycolatopsis samaneae TaxID=664691 RepID=A0ABW5GIP9_9PSEU
MLRRTLVSVLGIALAAVLVAAPTAHATTPAAPGDLLESQPTTVKVAVFPAPVRAWHLLYRSTSATGAANAVSGTLLVPPIPWTKGPRPLVSYAVGTHGLGDQCAPSNLLANGTENEIALIGQALSRGWAVVLTDYEGLGTPGDHTYAVGQSEGRAVLDAARAAARVPDAGLSPSGPVGVFGYSQGGQAAASAGELQPTYAPELNLVGVAEGGVPADLKQVMKFNDGNAGFSLVLGAATGFAAAYPELPFNDILNARGKALVPKVKQMCTVQLALAAPFGHLSDYTTVPDPAADPRWQARLDQNYLGRVKPKAPVFLYHASADELIPLAIGTGLRDRYQALGADVTWQEFPLLEHIGGVSVGGPVAMTWLGTKF